MKKVVISIISFLTGIMSSFLILKKIINHDSDADIMMSRYKKYYNLLIKWLRKDISNDDSIQNYFLENNFKTVAIYGMGEVGELLFEELAKIQDISVEYAIDSQPSRIFSDLDIYEKSENFPLVDIIIVTPIFAYDEIEKELKAKTKIKIVSLAEVINH